MANNPDYRGKTFVQPDGSIPKPGLTPPFAKAAQVRQLKGGGKKSFAFGNRQKVSPAAKVAKVKAVKGGQAPMPKRMPI